MRLNGIRAFLARELEDADRAAAAVRAKRLAMAASIAGLRAELAMLKNGGPQELAEITRHRLTAVVSQLETFDREVTVPAEARRHRAMERASRFEAFVERVIAA